MATGRKIVLGIGAGLFVLLLLVGLFPLFLQAGLGQETLRRAMEAELKEGLQREVRVQGLSFKPFLGALELRGFSLFGEGELAEVPVVEVERLTLRLSPWELFRRTLVVEQVALEGSRLLVGGKEAPSSADLADLLKSPAFAIRLLGIPLQLRIAKVLVVGGELHYRQPFLGVEAAAWLQEAQLRWGGGSLQGLLVFGPAELSAAGATFPLEEAKVAFEGDGDGLTVTALEAKLAGSAFTAQGRIVPEGEGAILDLHVSSRLGLERLAQLLGRDLKTEGVLQVQGRIQRRMSSPSFEGRGGLAEGTIGGLSLRDLTFQLHYSDGALTVTDLRASAFGGTLDGEGRLSPKDREFQAEFRFARMALASVLEHLWQRPSSLRGSVQGHLSLQGQGFKRRDVQGEATFLVEDLRADGWEETPGRLEARIALDGGKLRLVGLSLKRDSLIFTARGLLSKEGTSDLTIRGKIRKVSALGALLGVDGLGGSAVVRGRLWGSLEQPRFVGAIDWRNPRLFDIDFDRASGRLELDGRRLVMPRLVLHRGETALDLKGEVLLLQGKTLTRLDPKRDIALKFSLKGKGRVEDLASLSPRRVPIAGDIGVQASFEGIPLALVGGGRLSLRQVELLQEQWGSGEVIFVLEPGRLSLQRFSLRRGDEEVVGLGELRGEKFTVQLWSRGLDLGKVKALAGSGLKGMVRVMAEGWGNLEDPYFRGSFGVAAFTYRDLALGPGEGNFAWRGGTLSLDLSLGQGRYRLRSLLSIPRASYQAELTLWQASLDPFIGLLRRSPLKGLQGEASGRVQVQGLLDGRILAGTAEFSVFSLSFQGHRWQNVGPVAFTWQGNLVRIPLIRMVDEGKELRVEGNLEPGRWLDLRLEGRLPLSAFKPFVSEIASADGIADVKLAIAGPWGDVNATGSVATGRGKLRLSFLPWFLEDVRGALVLGEEGVHGEALEASLGGGRAKVQWVGRKGPQGWRHTVSFQLKGARADRVFGEPEWSGLVTGELSAKGRLFITARKGDHPLSSLQGELSLEMRQGRIKKFTVLSKIFSLLNPAQLLELKLPDLASAGMPYKSIKGDFTIKGGVARTEDLFLDSRSLRIGAAGKIDLVREEVDFKVGVRPFQTVDKLLSRIPLIGRILTGKEKSLIVSYYEVRGKTSDPEVRAIPLESLGRGIFGIFQRILELPVQLIAPLRR